MISPMLTEVIPATLHAEIKENADTAATVIRRRECLVAKTFLAIEAASTRTILGRQSFSATRSIVLTQIAYDPSFLPAKSETTFRYS